VTPISRVLPPISHVHPHVHAIASRGGWTKDGTWVPIPYVDSGAAARLFRHKVLRLLLAAGRIDAERVELILGWRHTSSFSVHNEVVVQSGDGDGLERLARYLARPPVSLQRMEWDREKGEVLYRAGRGHAEERGGEEERRDMSSGSTNRSFWREWSCSCRSRESIRSGTTAITPRS
jgi:Putative transposase